MIIYSDSILIKELKETDLILFKGRVCNGVSDFLKWMRLFTKE